MANTINASSALTATLVRTPEELKPYAGQWNELLESSRANTIFLTWEWIEAWCKAVFPDVELAVVVVRGEDGQLVAVAPFYCSDLRLLGSVRYRCLRVLGDAQSGAEYGDLIIRRGFERAATACVLEMLQRQEQLWDCIFIRNMTGRTGSIDELREACDAVGLVLRQRGREFSSTTLPHSYDVFLSGLSANRRQQLRRMMRKAHQSHDLELVRCERQEQLSDMLRCLFSLHRKRWESVGQSGSFVRRPDMQRFYETFAPTALSREWLRLYALKVDGAVRAVQYGYVYNNVFSQLQEGFDSDGYEGVGNVLRSLIIQACIEEGLSEYDFLGGFSEHKRRWGAESYDGADVLIVRRRVKTAVLVHTRVWPTGRFMHEGTPVSQVSG